MRKNCRFGVHFCINFRIPLRLGFSSHFQWFSRIIAYNTGTREAYNWYPSKKIMGDNLFFSSFLAIFVYSYTWCFTRKYNSRLATTTDSSATSPKKNVVHWAGVARVDSGCEARVAFLRKTSWKAIHENCQNEEKNMLSPMIFFGEYQLYASRVPVLYAIIRENHCENATKNRAV